MTSVQEIAEREPWRTRQGQPVNILDPAWQGEKPNCDGTVDWEGGSRWWHCQKCGYCGTASTTVHVAPVHPQDDITNAVDFFMAKRAAEGVDHETATNQLLFVAAAAIRYAATKSPDQLGQYVRNNLTLR